MSQTDVASLPEHPIMFAPSTTLDFAEQSQLTYLIPSESNLNLEEAFKNLEPGKSILDSIERRESLFFDETVDVLLVLKTPWTDERTLRSYLGRLVISLEAQIANSNTPGRDSLAASDTIFSGNVADVEDPFIVVDEDEGTGDEADDDDDDDEDVDDDETDNGKPKSPGPSIYAAWKLPVYLARPRIRLNGPSVVFSASASLKPDISTELIPRGTGYLPSGVPAGFNLLESFSNDAALEGVKPRLSALRVSRVAPVTRPQDLMNHIRALQQLELKIFPVVHTRIRFSRPNTAPSSAAVIALLEIDFTSYFDCEISLDKIHMSIPDSTVESLNDGAGMQLPLSCVSHDHITFLYHITPHELDVTPKNPTRDLAITISATAHIVPGHCTPSLTMSWTTNLDFTTPVNPGFTPTTGAGIQRSHRPSQLSITGLAVHPLKSPSITRPDSLPVLEAATTHTEATLPELGITMTFSGPSDPVRPGDVFSWTVYVVNRTSEHNSRPPRKLALVAVPKRRRNEVRMTRPPSTGGRRRGEKEIADAIMDDNVLHAMQKNYTVEPTEVVCLSADTRVGPLAPGACHVIELQFLALHEGIVGMEAIRVVDLGSQEHVDVRELPTMIVEPAVA
ncbi:TRAPP trafficking subunit Trs65-domain-containing protein [Dactylonectria estremocensis]|uniref:TRAPP trafficking subunit Trs65-domain-containing protein n=1 Tax=Dactylonectria estremocensis TaxID=1079267 RepID=A0A9P9JEP2_9HYPO|nr:TRAPP trafficking subunit Trs65-domain-containing protein [Dactylonectria estremocensis]